MKKTRLLCLSMLAALTLTGCGGEKAIQNSFIELEDDETLFVGPDIKFKNTLITDTIESVIEYPAYVEYNLNRQTYNLNDGVFYEGYYYYWSVNTTYDTEVIGHITTTRKISYSYMPYTKDEFLALRTRISTNTKYDYSSGIMTFPRICTIEINDYFENMSEIAAECIDLYNKVNRDITTKIYVSARERTVVNSQLNNYDTYFSVEKM